MASPKAIAIKRQTALNELAVLLDIQIPANMDSTPLKQAQLLELIVEGVRRLDRKVEKLNVQLDEVNNPVAPSPKPKAKKQWGKGNAKAKDVETSDSAENKADYTGLTPTEQPSDSALDSDTLPVGDYPSE